MTRYAFIDFRTTGIDTDNERIIEIGVVRKDTDNPYPSKTDRFETLVNPGISLDAESSNGITEDQIADAPSFDEVSNHLSKLLDGSIIVSHDANHNISVLKSEYERLGLWLPVSINQCICTMVEGRRRGLSGNLSEMVTQLDLTVDPKANKAIDDASSASQIFAAFQLGLQSKSPWSYESVYLLGPRKMPKFVTR